MDNPTYIPNLDSYQRILAKVFELDLAAFTARSNSIDLQGPWGSIVVGGHAMIVTAFDTGTTDVLSIGDAGSATRYLNAKDLKAAANTLTSLTLTGFEYTDNTGPFLRITRTPAGTAATTGKVRIVLFYVSLGKVDGTDN
jgi:hypothetical protein